MAMRPENETLRADLAATLAGMRADMALHREDGAKRDAEGAKRDAEGAKRETACILHGGHCRHRSHDLRFRDRLISLRSQDTSTRGRAILILGNKVRIGILAVVAFFMRNGPL